MDLRSHRRRRGPGPRVRRGRQGRAQVASRRRRPAGGRLLTDALELSRSRTYPVGVGRAFDAVLPLPLPSLFARRYAALPAIREVRDQEGAWGTVGQTRTIVLADRSTMRETLVGVERPASFGYRIDQLHGPMRPLAASVDGRWTFEEAGTGVRITWSWTVHPATAATALLMPAFGRMWQGYARQALEELESLLLR